MKTDRYVVRNFCYLLSCLHRNQRAKIVIFIDFAKHFILFFAFWGLFLCFKALNCHLQFIFLAKKLHIFRSFGIFAPIKHLSTITNTNI